MFAILCLVCLPLLQVSAEEDLMIVYAQVPEDWENPCVWAWADDGTNAFEAWPGGSMKEDESNAGWYYAYVPKAAGGNVIINANEGAVQTSDHKTDSKDVWLTITDAETVEVSNEKQTQGDLPENEAMISVNVQVPEEWTMPCLWAWSAPDGTNVFANWPGQELTAQTDGWYSYEIPAWVNSVIVNGNLGEVQTSDITIEPKDVWLIITDAETYEVLYEKPVVETPAEDMITVHAKAPADWLMPCLWAWSAPDGTNVFANWPGQELTEDADGWYSYDIPNWVNSIIINGNLGEVQTTDITIEPKELWVVVTDGETYEVFYEEPAVVADTPSEPESVSSEPESVPSDSNQVESSENSNTMVIIIVIVVAVIAVGGIIGYTVYKKKSK